MTVFTPELRKRSQTTIATIVQMTGLFFQSWFSETAHAGFMKGNFFLASFIMHACLDY